MCNFSNFLRTDFSLITIFYSITFRVFIKIVYPSEVVDRKVGEALGEEREV
jgi:hypothetical protein